MWRPASFAVLTLPLLVPPARAQATAGDSAPAFRLSYRYPSVGVAYAPALAPGGRLGLRIGAIAVANAWARRVQDALPAVDVAHPPASSSPLQLQLLIVGESPRLVLAAAPRPC